MFSKSTYNLVFFSPLGFKNNVTQVAVVIRDALPKPFSKVFHHYVGHLWGNGGNFLTNSVLKCFEGLRPIFINLGLEVSPQEKITGGQIRWARAIRYRLVRRRVDGETFLSKFPANDERCGLWPRPAKTKSPPNHQILPIWTGGSSVTFHNTD